MDSVLGHVLWTTGHILLVTVGLLLALTFLLYADRKIWASVQLRRGPNDVGPFGLVYSCHVMARRIVSFTPFVLSPVITGDHHIQWLQGYTSFNELLHDARKAKKKEKDL